MSKVSKGKYRINGILTFIAKSWTTYPKRMVNISLNFKPEGGKLSIFMYVIAVINTIKRRE